MQREDRYVVLKRADIEKYLTSEQRWAQADLADQIAMGRALDGRRTDKQFVCVADDWPEYEAVWSMIEARVDGTMSPRSPGGYVSVQRKPDNLEVATLCRLMDDCLPEQIDDERDMQKLIDKLWPALVCEFERET